jgi:hypothetical protein
MPKEGGRAVKIAKGRAYSVITIISLLLLTGCATAPYDEGTGLHSVFETELLLSEAGFEMRTAQSPEELEYLKTLTQRTIISRIREDTIEYAYADATYCKCLYVGTGVAYQRYLRLLKLEKDARREEQARRWDRTWRERTP